MSHLSSADLGGQEWNGHRVLELVRAARSVRSAQVVDPGLASYRAEARGFVYFLLDRDDLDEQSLIKADQVALEVYWKAPSSTRQRIVGLRDEKLLPTDIQYHLDHLTVVQDDFSDRIRLGDGDEVSDVVHPMAPGSDNVYDFRLTDSLTISFPGDLEPVRVYKLEVRPKTAELPGFVGSVFVDRATSAIVRMSFTFTASSYVDPYLDYIRISLDNSLWLGRHWLPYRQEVELRRELPILDALAGSLIRSRFQIRDYELNPELPDEFFLSRRVTALPEARRRLFPFEEGLFSQLDEDGLAPTPSLEEIEEEARRMVQGRYLRGLAALRLHVPDASSVYRFSRAEGNVFGMGTTVRPTDGWMARVLGGYATGSKKPSLLARLSPAEDPWLEIEGRLHRPLDHGPQPGASGVLRSIGALSDGQDWTDPWFGSGFSIGWRPSDDPVRLSARWERHRSAMVVIDRGDPPPPVRPIEEGDLLAGSVEVETGGGLRPTDGLGFDATWEHGVLDGAGYSRVEVGGAFGRTASWAEVELLVQLRAGVARSADGETPSQFLYLLGGRETLLGHDYRSQAGNAFWLLHGEVSRSVWSPWLSLRAFVAAGEAVMTGTAPIGWGDLATSGARLSVGAGVGLLWDALLLDVGKGVDGGDWSVAFSIAPRFRAWM